MITRLTLRNFQCHPRLVIDFDPSVTTFVGPTDSGKSSALRGLYWIALNEPPGARFVSWGTEKCSAILEFDNHILKRVRSDKVNYYILDGKKFQALGRGVPPEITNALNLSSANFQKQIALPFWFCSTPGQVSRDLNAIVNLGVIDRSLARAAGEIRKSRTVVEVSQTRLQAAREEAAALKIARTSDQALRKVEAIERGVGRLKEVEDTLADLVSEGQTLTERMNALSKDIPGAAKWAKLELAREQLEEVQEREDRLQALVSQVIPAEDKVRWTAKLAEGARAEFEEANKGRCPLCGTDRSP